jgi:hypothetical protein
MPRRRQNRYMRAVHEVAGAPGPILLNASPTRVGSDGAPTATRVSNFSRHLPGCNSVEINRNQYFLIGLIVLFLGLQFRVVETYVLNEKTSTFLAQRLKLVASSDSSEGFLPAAGPAPLRTVAPPTWLGYAFISVSAVLILHSLAMRKPGG